MFAPPRWSDDELEEDRLKTIDIFIDERLKDEIKNYLETFRMTKDMVERLFKVTNDLLDLKGKVFEEDPQLIEPARYLGCRPISQDDLDVLARENVTRRKNISPEGARRGARAIRAVLDPIRFSWISDQRPPSKEERAKAIEWTAGLWANQQLGTKRRMELSYRQEEAAIKIIQDEGFVMDLSVKEIQNSIDLDKLHPGKFAKQIEIKTAKCDVAVRLLDGRLLVIECKASNSYVNSIKRLIRETGGTAIKWLDEFGEQIIPCAVLSGIYKLKNLQDAQQEYNITIFWEHKLESLRDFLKKSR